MRSHTIRGKCDNDHDDGNDDIAIWDHFTRLRGIYTHTCAYLHYHHLVLYYEVMRVRVM